MNEYQTPRLADSSSSDNQKFVTNQHKCLLGDDGLKRTLPLLPYKQQCSQAGRKKNDKLTSVPSFHYNDRTADVGDIDDDDDECINFADDVPSREVLKFFLKSSRQVGQQKIQPDDALLASTRTDDVDEPGVDEYVADDNDDMSKDDDDDDIGIRMDSSECSDEGDETDRTSSYTISLVKK